MCSYVGFFILAKLAHGFHIVCYYLCKGGTNPSQFPHTTWKTNQVCLALPLQFFFSKNTVPRCLDDDDDDDDDDDEDDDDDDDDDDDVSGRPASRPVLPRPCQRLHAPLARRQ